MSETIPRANKPYKPYITLDINGKFACTLCGFTTYGKFTFRRHLILTHGIKLMELEPRGTSADYGLIDKVTSEDSPYQNGDRCSRCNYTFVGNATGAMEHMIACEKSFKKHLESNMAPLKCPECNLTFFLKKRWRQHKRYCGGPFEIQCVICTFSSISFSKTRRHILDKHNLIAKRSKEVDFEQAVKRAPYTLCRPFELDKLPTRNDVKNKRIPTEISDQIRLSKNGKSRMKVLKNQEIVFTCEKCKTQFLKESSFNRHRKICIFGYIFCKPLKNTNPEKLQQGKVLKNKIKKFACAKCKTKFSEKGLLNIHKKTCVFSYRSSEYSNNVSLKKSHTRRHKSND